MQAEAGKARFLQDLQQFFFGMPGKPYIERPALEVVGTRLAAHQGIMHVVPIGRMDGKGLAAELARALQLVHGVEVDQDGAIALGSNF